MRTYIHSKFLKDRGKTEVSEEITASHRKKRRILSKKDMMFGHRRVFNCNYPVQDIMCILSNKQNHKYQNRTFCSAQ